MKGIVQVLGSGASMGIPVMGCSCSVCISSNPKNKRLRPSILIKAGGKNVLVDCGPDLRQQFLNYQIMGIDGLVITHAHYDHVEGLDELRALSMVGGKFTPCLLSRETLNDLHRRFYYIFENQHSEIIMTSRLNLQQFDAKRGRIDFCGLPFKYFTYEQMGMEVQGIRLGNMAYVSDIKNYPETIFEDLKGVDILILSALRHSESRMHFTVDDAVTFALKSGVKHCWLTHIAHDLDHEKTNQNLPKNVQLAYDGQLIEFNYD